MQSTSTHQERETEAARAETRKLASALDAAEAEIATAFVALLGAFDRQDAARIALGVHVSRHAHLDLGARTSTDEILRLVSVLRPRLAALAAENPNSWRRAKSALGAFLP